MELRYCKRSPSGVSHFQGPPEHMRRSCGMEETEGGGRMKHPLNTLFHEQELAQM